MKEMEEKGVKKIVLRYQEKVYGEKDKMKIKEDKKIQEKNKYGRKKIVIEEMMREIYKSENRWEIEIMRYLNNVGDNERGIIGEEKKGIKKNMMKIIDKVENGRREKMKIWGKEYKKKDGKGVREYINVKDMDEGKIKEMKKMDKKK